LSEDIVRKTFSHETTVIFLVPAEDNFHDENSAINQTERQVITVLAAPVYIESIPDRDRSPFPPPA